MSQTQETIDLNRLLDPVSRCLTPDVAKQLINLRVDPVVQERLDTLAERCNEGQLSSDERAEYETYVRAIDFIAILQAKARRQLANSSPS